MLASLAFLVVAPPTIVAPILAPGCSSEFQRMVVSVEESLSSGDFAAAGKKLQLLPKPLLTFSWNDSNLPAGKRAEFAQARDTALAEWTGRLSQYLDIKPGSPADIKFEFAAKLNATDSGALPGLATFVSETTLPRMEAVLGLARGSDERSTSVIDVQNDVEYSVGKYLGVGDRPIATTSMARTDAFAFRPSVVTAAELGIAKRNLMAVQVLRDAVHAGVRLQALQPKVSFDTESLSYGPVMQGTEAQITLLVTNIGQAPLSCFMMPSCSCITAGPEFTLKPNEARLATINVDTSVWTHTLNKQLMVLTNDPDKPVREIPIEVKVTPRYRWIVPGGASRLVPDAGSNIDLFLEIPFGSEIYANSARFEGVPGTVTFEPFSADMADPDEGQGVQHRDGYRVKLHVKGPIPGGRQLGTVIVDTTSEKYPQISFMMAFQSGIVAEPAELNMGTVSASKTFTIQLTRPEKPFRVLSVDTTSKTLSASFAKMAGSNNYRVEVRLGAKPVAGDYTAILHVYTDDPRQSKIDIAVRGTVE